ncbi:MAG: hypothetical protein P4L36_12835 [Holophaga sp.]|nr:hypothetical protein [Holophaga sp.]
MPTHRWSHLLAAITLSCWPGLRAAAPEPAYHGGALVVTDPALHPGHLSPGQVLPIRLSRLVPPAGAAPPALQGCEAPGSVRYGQLVFGQLSPACVTFTVTFSPAGTAPPPRTVTLRLGDSVDLAGDGLPDLALRAPVKALTAGAVAIDYALLAFSCDAGHTAMFALAPEAFQDARYPYGISGVTPSGGFIFQSDCLPLRASGVRGGNRASFQADRSLLVEPAPGDVLVEVRTGRLERIERVRRTLDGMELQYAPAGTPFLFREVFGAAWVHVSGKLADLGRRYRCGRSAPGPQWDWQENLVDLSFSQPLMDDADGRMELQVAVRLGVSLDLSANVNYYGLTAQLGAEVDEALRLAMDYRGERPWRHAFGPYTVAKPEVGFTVCGVPMSVSMELTAGLDLDNQDTGTALQGLRSTGRWGWSAALAASWGWRGIRVNASDPVLSDTLVIQGLPENRSDLNGHASISPWMTISPRLGFASFFYGECPNKLALVTSAGGGHAQEDVSYQLSAGFKLELPVLGTVWERTWPLYQWSDTVWSFH